VFRLRMKLCSSLFPVNERIRDFFLEYDRHTLRTSPPWGSELLEVCLVFSTFAMDSYRVWQILKMRINCLHVLK
jgi:dedicator of cytokinesis protein 6/7/8